MFFFIVLFTGSVDLDVRILFSDNQLYLELYHQCLDFSQTYDSSNDNCCYLHFGEIGQRYVGSPNRDEVVKDVIKRRCDKLYEYFAEAVKVQIIFEVFSAGSGAIALLLSENDYKRVANKQFVFTLDRNKFDLHFYTMKDIFRLLQEIAKTQQEQEKNEQQREYFYCFVLFAFILFLFCFSFFIFFFDGFSTMF